MSYPRTPLILVSATIGDAKAAALVQLGVCAYVPKSRLVDLPSAIEAALSRPPPSAATGDDGAGAGAGY